MSDMKVVQLGAGSHIDAISALKEIVRELEAGEIEFCETGALVLVGANGAEVFGFGPRADDLRVLGALRMAEHSILDGE